MNVRVFKCALWYSTHRRRRGFASSSFSWYSRTELFILLLLVKPES